MEPYLLAADVADATRSRYRTLAAHPERGAMNISKAIYAALAVALGTLLVAVVTAAVNNRIGEIT